MKKILLLMVLALFSGCAAKRALLENDIRYDDSFCDFAVDSVVFNDERPGTSDASFTFTFWSKPGTVQSAQQALTAAHRGIIDEEIRLHHAGPSAAEHYVLKVFVVTAEKKFTAVTRFSGSEAAHVVLKMELWRPGATTFTKSMSGDSYLEVRSLTGSNEYIEQIFRKAIRASIAQCFESFRKP